MVDCMQVYGQREECIQLELGVVSPGAFIALPQHYFFWLILRGYHFYNFGLDWQYGNIHWDALHLSFNSYSLILLMHFVIDRIITVYVT